MPEESAALRRILSGDGAPPVSLLQYPRLSISWDRSRGSAGLSSRPLTVSRSLSAPVCLWTAGFVANRSELGRELELAQPVRDEELLVLLVERYGAEVAATRIAGPFAWLMWLPDQDRLVAVRDRQGAHQIYLSQVGPVVNLGGGWCDLAAASSRGIDPLSAAAHLAGAGPPPGHSYFRDVEAVEPGELISVSSRRIDRRPYWRLETRRPLRANSDEDYADRLRALLAQVAAEYCSTDRFGVTLSGGMDSTTVAASLTQVAPDRRPVAVRWVAPELPESDESAESGAVARRLGMPSVEVRADLNWPLSRGFPAGTPDGPEITCYPDLWTATFEAARVAGLRVLYTGSSGDNLFGGVVSCYPDLLLTFRWVRLARQLREHLPHSRLGLTRIVRRLVLAPVRTAWLGRAHLRPPAWLSPQAREAALEAWGRAPKIPYLRLPGRRQHLAQLTDRLPALVGAQLGRRAAEHGLELRQPLRDHRLIELAASLPPDQIFRAGQWKIVVRNAMRDRLPAEVLARRGKITPDSIFRRGLWERERGRVRALFEDMRTADLGLVEPATLRSAFDRYFEAPGGDSRFWQALTLESWLRRFS